MQKVTTMSIKTYRRKIDAIDSKIVHLLNDRAQMSLEIGQEKVKHNKGIYAPDRETQVLQRVKALSKGPMSAQACEAIYREIMSSSLALEKPLRVASLGMAGSFSYLAAQKKFGSQVEYVSCQSIPEVFQRVEDGDCDHGVVPIENSTEGAVTWTFDFLVDSEVKICSQLLLRVSHALMSKAPMDKIRNVYSNPQVFGQCRHWLLQNLPKVGQLWVPSTTQAAQIATREKNSAAIASVQTAEIYKLPILKRDIQDIAHNTTRFLVLGREDARPTGKDRTSIVFSIKDRVGALHAMLSPFYQNKINLTKIESRPSKKKAWDYYFFVDFEGHREEKSVKRALAKLEDMCKYLKILGSYPVQE